MRHPKPAYLENTTAIRYNESPNCTAIIVDLKPINGEWHYQIRTIPNNNLYWVSRKLILKLNPNHLA